MKIVELDIKLPYDKRGKILSKLCDRVRGKIKDIHFFPPTASGISEIKMKVETENVQKLLQDLKRIIKEGKISFKVLSEA
ncbi:hypothetical protein [Thermococcus paralvinellae]|uniref:Acetolactate synthase small subunit n=1 Tax=Thermococcus paralvinellae TaxID=582419 RepID=W0I6Z2_9EURY|nr:hypothetical protein [Thermococcus paralvinellae]AHF80477.1 Hypothetical protein TES1_1093 [Thermococcus paralvinellae]